MLLQHTLTPTLQFPNGTVPTSLECTTGDWNVFAHQADIRSDNKILRFNISTQSQKYILTSQKYTKYINNY